MNIAYEAVDRHAHGPLANAVALRFLSKRHARHESGARLAAISLRRRTLIAPALHDADRQMLEEIMVGVRDLVQRARAAGCAARRMSDPTITVTNLGERGVDLLHGVIYPPQVALVGFGVVRERPWAVAEMLGVCRS